MADPLSSKDVDDVRNHLNKAGNRSCPICARITWEIVGVEAGINLTSPISTAGGVAMTVFPVVTLMCLGCGFVQHFSLQFIRAKALVSLGES